MSSTTFIFEKVARTEQEFKSVIQAVKREYRDDVNKYLTANSKFLEQCDERGLTLMHHALTLKSPEILRAIHAHLVKNDMTKLLLKPNPKDGGSTLMHWAVDHANYNMLFAFVGLFEPGLIHDAVTIKDDGGQNSLQYAKYGIKYNLLLPYALENHFGDYNKKVDASAVLERYSEKIKADASGRLAYNINHACNLLTATLAVEGSDAHPAVNPRYRSSDLRVISDKIESLRYEAKQEREKLIQEYKDDKLGLRTALLNNNYNLMKMNPVGNCIDMVFFGMKVSCDLDPNVRSEGFEVRRGDHAFMAIDRAFGSSATKFSEWGEFAVCVCFLSREIFLPDEIPYKVSYWYRDPNGIVTGPLNFNFHSINRLDWEHNFEPEGVIVKHPLETVVSTAEKQDAIQKITDKKSEVTTSPVKSSMVRTVVPASLMAIRNTKPKAAPDVVGFRSFLMSA